MHGGTRTLGRVAFAGLLAMLGSGCERGCDHKAPFTPYRITDGDGAIAVDAGVQPRDSGTAEGPQSQGPIAELSLSGKSLRAPAGSVFLRVLYADLDGDGATDALAVTASADGDKLLALVMARGISSSITTLALESIATFDAAAPGCAPRAQLTSVVDITAAAPNRVRAIVDAGLLCSAAGVRAPGKLLVVSADATKARVRLEISTHWASGSIPTVRAAAIDLDNDGEFDLDMTLTRANQSVHLAWFSKASGYSPDVREPQTSLAGLAAEIRSRAERHTDATRVLADATAARQWINDVCEGASLSAGTMATSCLGALALIDEALVRSAIGDHEVPTAFAYHALARTEAVALKDTHAVYPAAQMEALLLAATRKVDVSEGRLYPTESAVEANGVVFGRLTFESDTVLLVREKERVMKIDLEAGTTAPAPIAAYPLDVAVGPAARWVGVSATCDGIFLQATLDDTAHGEHETVALPLLAPLLGSRCVQNARQLPPRMGYGVHPIETSAESTLAYVMGQAVQIAADRSTATLESLTIKPSQAIRFGTPRTQDNRFSVIPTGLGLLVTEVVPSGSSARPAPAPKPALMRGPKVFAEESLSSCTVAPNGKRVACMHGGEVVVYP